MFLRGEKTPLDLEVPSQVVPIFFWCFEEVGRPTREKNSGEKTQPFHLLLLTKKRILVFVELLSSKEGKEQMYDVSTIDCTFW